MEVLIGLIVVALIIFVIVKSVATKRAENHRTGDVWVAQDQDDTSSSTPASKMPDIDVSMYQKRHRLMNNSESSFFYLALKNLPDGYHIFPKMRIADIIETKDGNGYYKQRNKILPKHVDFVICDKNLRPVCAVEIDGKSHDTDKMRERDELVEYIFEYVGIPLERVMVGDDFNRVCNEMRQYLTPS